MYLIIVGLMLAAMHSAAWPRNCCLQIYLQYTFPFVNIIIVRLPWSHSINSDRTSSPLRSGCVGIMREEHVCESV